MFMLELWSSVVTHQGNLNSKYTNSHICDFHYESCILQKCGLFAVIIVDCVIYEKKWAEIFSMRHLLLL